MIGSAGCPRCGTRMYISKGEKSICPKCGYGATTPIQHVEDDSSAASAPQDFADSWRKIFSWLDWLIGKSPKLFGWLSPVKRKIGTRLAPRRELGEARQWFEWREFDRCITAAEPFLNSSETDLQREANTLVGLSHLRKKDYALSLPFLEKVTEIRGYAVDWQYVAVAAVLARDLEKSRVAFKQAIACCKHGTSEETSESNIHLDYASALVDAGEFYLALEQIGWLRPIYEGGITDDTYLWLRGIPSLGQVAHLVVRIYRGLGDISSGKVWLENLSASVDEDGKVVLGEYLYELENKT